MAMIDYGALLRINGNFINKNSIGLFMDMKDSVGFTLEKAMDSEQNEIYINDNFYVYAGNEDLLLCFYKTYFYIIKNGMIIKFYRGSDFSYESMFIEDTVIKVEHLNKDYIIEKEETDENDKKFLSPKRYQKYVNYIIRKNRKNPYKYRTSRYIATWEYNGNHYEVIFGYGVEPNKEVWDRIKFESYDFTDKERKIIDKWFE